MSVGPSLVGKLILIDGMTTTVRHNPSLDSTRDLKSVIIVLVSLVLNVLRIHPSTYIYIYTIYIYTRFPAMRGVFYLLITHGFCGVIFIRTDFMFS